MKVLVTGATGQLGRSLLESVPEGIEAIGIDRRACDLNDAQQCLAVVRKHRPDVLINCAAYTKVDNADTERDAAVRVNTDAPGHLAQGVAESGGRLIQISTDFVFDGMSSRAYMTDAPTAPLNVYGSSKLGGEEQVLKRLGKAATVIRTAWVYSSSGANFVRTMLRLMASRESVSVVCDQIGSPTWARSLARAVWTATVKPEASGILHWTDCGVASWYDFAVAIQEEALARGLLLRPVPVRPIATADYLRQFPATVARPPFSVLDLRSTRDALASEPPHWRSNLRLALDELTPQP